MGDGGKGDTQRPTDWDKFNKNFDEIFGKKQPEPETKEPPKEGNNHVWK